MIIDNNEGVIDTVIVPARKSSFEDYVLQQQMWHHIRIHTDKLPLIKYIAFYQVAPTSAITHVAPVASIEPWEEDNNYYKLNFSSKAVKIDPIVIKQPKGKYPQGSWYTMKTLLDKAETLEDL